MKKILLLLLLLACAVLPAQALTVETQGLAWYRLHMGLGTGEAAVSPEEGRNFIDAEITTRFPNGLTITECAGQWSSPEYGLTREIALVIDLQVPDNPESKAQIAAIANSYIERYKKARASLFVMRLQNLDTTLYYLP